MTSTSIYTKTKVFSLCEGYPFSVIASLPKAGVAITYSIARNDLKQMLTTNNY